MGDRVVAHFLDSDYAGMPTTVEGELSARPDECSGAIAFVVVGRRAIRPADLVSVHAGACDHTDPRSERARQNFRRKYE